MFEKTRFHFWVPVGGQHALLGYAQNILGRDDVEHGEMPTQGGRALISPLVCALVEARQLTRLAQDSSTARAYGTSHIDEDYRCRYGLNPQFAAALLDGALKAIGWDEGKEVRVVELTGSGFFFATLFQPERVALAGQVLPLARS